jgi:hypothetical protein
VLIEDETQAVRGDRPRNLAAVLRRIRSQQPEAEEPRHLDVVRRDRRQLGEQGCAEIQVRTVRLAGQLAQAGAMLDIELLAPGALARDGAGALGGRLGGDLRREIRDGPADRLPCELAVHGAVGDDRRAPVKLDQDAGSAGLIDVSVGEANLRGPVGVAIDLAMQRLGLREQRGALLAQPQRLQI